MGAKEAALKYRNLGFSVIPTKKGSKEPLLKWTDYQERIADDEEIKQWFKEWPDAGIAIVTGKISGIIVLDRDSEEGKRFLEGKKHRLSPVAETGKGVHYYFKHPGGEIHNLVRAVEGVDIKGDGGYVIAPPSVHPSGTEYRWHDGFEPWTVKLAPAPDWLIELIERKTEEQGAPGGGGLDPKEILAGISEGERNEKIFRYACCLREKDLEKEEARCLILEAARAASQPFTDEEALNCLESAWRYSPKRISLLTTESLSGESVIFEGSSQRAILKWVSEGVFANVQKLKEHSDGRITGMLTIGTTLPGAPSPIHQALFNFTSTRSRSELIRILNDEAAITNWPRIIETLSSKIIGWVEEGTPIIEISTASAPRARSTYLLKPLILQETPTILFGERGTAKSYTALLLTLLSSLGPDSSPLKALGFQLESLCRPLYLDWELSEPDLENRLRQLRGGLALDDDVTLLYRRCSRSLASDADRIKNMMMASEIDLIIIDSLGPACSGDLNAAEVALDFFEALRMLDVPTLVIAHTAKNTKGKKTVYGSVFFENLARSVWEVQAEPEPGEDDLGVGFRQRKNTFGKIELPFGLRFHFSPGATIVKRQDLMEITGGEQLAPTGWRIKGLLGREGAMTIPEISELLSGLSQGAIREALRRGFDRGEFAKLSDGRWGLADMERIL